MMEVGAKHPLMHRSTTPQQRVAGTQTIVWRLGNSNLNESVWCYKEA
jgi:hypothetical protein